MAKTLDEDVEQIFNDEDATATAVKSLINVEDREKGKTSSVELKTDLNTANESFLYKLRFKNPTNGHISKTSCSHQIRRILPGIGVFNVIYPGN